MTPLRLALLLSPLLPLAPALLLLSACGKERSNADERSDGPSAPLGFELAMVGAGAGAGAAASAADDTAAAAAAPTPSPLITLSPEELAARLAKGNVRLIDVRTDAEVAEGMIPGAEHIPLDQFDPASLDPSDGREVVLYCRSGRRSAIAGEKLAAATGQPVEHLGGGILAWEAAGQPTTPR
jgi:rhodanese-related sulfurtransferase